VLYKGDEVLAVSTDGNSLELHRLDDELTSFLILDDSLDIDIRNLYVSPCRRILMVEEKRDMTIYDTMNASKVHSFDCAKGKMQYLTQDLCFYTYQEYIAKN
jgi:hypothetical protein